MKIAVDITRAIELQKTGIPMYQAKLFEQLLALPGHTYVPMYYGATANHVKKFGEKKILSFRNPYAHGKLFLKDFFDRLISGSMKNAKFDLMHSTAHFTVKGFEDRTVLTIHDLIFMRDPDYYNKKFVDLVRSCVGKVRKIIAVSHTTKLDILEQFPFIPEDRIDVVYAGARKDCVQVKNLLALKDFKRNFFGDENFKYILYFGSFTKRKNISNVIKAYALLVKKNRIEHKLVLGGKPAENYDQTIALIASLGLQDSIVVKNYVDDSVVSELYSAADAFVFPSYYEGFGLPVIEAMQCGCPCVVSNVSSLKELFSGAALMVDPDSIESIAGAIDKLLSDPLLREKYRELGFAKAKEFSWEKTAKDTLRVYESV